MLLSKNSMASMGIVLDVAGRTMAVYALEVLFSHSVSAAGHLTFNALDAHATAASQVPGPPVEKNEASTSRLS